MLRTLFAHILHHLLDRLPVPALVNLKAQTGYLLRDPLAQRIALLANSTGEDQSIDLATQRHVVAADIADDAVAEYVKGQLHLGIGLRRGDGAEVGGSREGFPAGFFVEDLFGAGDVQGLGGGWGKFADVGGIVEY